MQSRMYEQMDAVDCHYFLSGPPLDCQPQSIPPFGRYQIILLGDKYTV